MTVREGLLVATKSNRNWLEAGPANRFRLLFVAMSNRGIGKGSPASKYDKDFKGVHTSNSYSLLFEYGIPTQLVKVAFKTEKLPPYR